MTVKIQVSPVKASKKGNTIRIQGELTVANASYIKEEMIKAIEKYSLLKLVIDEVERLDLSVLQLIYAFQIAAINGGKQVELGMNLPEDLRQLVQKSGLNKIFNQTV